VKIDPWYEAAMWVVILGGLAPAGYFLVTWRPRRRWSLRQLDAGGWVLVIWLLYALAAFRLAAGHYRQPSTAVDGALALVVGAGIDAVLWLRVARWVSFRRHPDHPLRRRTDPCVDDELVEDDVP